MPWPRNSIRALVWDWNGTLLDDVDAGLTTTNQVLTEFGLPGLDGRDAYRRSFGFPIRDFYSRLGFAADEHFTAASTRYVEIFPVVLARSRLQQHAAEVLAAVRRRGVAQVLISATVTDALHRQLAPHPVAALVDEVLGSSDPLNPSKQDVVSDWLGAQPWRPDQVLMVGDTNHDEEIAALLGTRFARFTGGHQHGGAGDVQIDDLRQVLDLL